MQFAALGQYIRSVASTRSVRFFFFPEGMVRIHVASAVVLFCLSMGLLCPSRLMAQGLFGTISGTVTDSSGAVVVGATVKVTNIDTNVTVALKTNSAGVYNATNLNPGMYKVEAEAKGFETGVADKVLLEVNANPRVDLALIVGEANEVVEVSGNAAMLHTQQSDLGQTLNATQLQELPTQGSGGRSPSTLPAPAPRGSPQKGCPHLVKNGNLR